MRNRLRVVQREGLPPGSVEAYGFAIGCVAAAALGGFAYLRFVDDVTLAIPYYAAVFVSALLTGVGGGTVAAALSVLLLWWIDSEYFGSGVPALVRSVNGASYILCAISAIWIAVQLRQRGHGEKRPQHDASPQTGVVVPFPVRLSGMRRLRATTGSLWHEGLAPHSAAAFVFALVCVTLATVLRFGLGFFGDDMLPFVSYFPAVLIATVVAGLEGGLLALIASLMVVGWAFVPPYFAVGMPTPDQVVDCELFLFSALISVWLIERYRYDAARASQLTALVEVIGPVIFAIGLVLATTLLLLAVQPILGPEFLVLGYLVPTAIVALLYGNIFALLTSFACGLAATYFLFPPKFSLNISDPGQIAALGVFFLVAIATNKIISILTYGAGARGANRRREVPDGRFYPSKLERARTGVLLIHSVGGTPRELEPVATGLSERGYTVSCCNLAGHGGSEEDLLASGWKDWFASAEQALTVLEKQCDVIVVGGLSEGSILALRLAAFHPTRVNGLCLFAPTLKYDGWAVPWYSFLLMLGLRAPFLRRMRITDPPPYGIKDEATRALIAQARHGDASHEPVVQSTSLGTLQESHWLTRDVIRRLSSIKAPALIVHPREDDISDISNAIYLQRRLGGLVDFWVLDDSYHLITIDRQRDVVMTRTAEFISFIERYSKRQFAAPRRAQPAIVAGREFASPPRTSQATPDESA